MSESAIKKPIESLYAEGDRPRVWSIIITLFGDAILPRGGIIRMGAIQELFSSMDIESSALRTAMSRLAKDGWLERKRIGRASYYHLSENRKKFTIEASKRIYRFNHVPWTGDWRFVVRLKGMAENTPLADRVLQALEAQGYVNFNANLYVKPIIDEWEKMCPVIDIAGDDFYQTGFVSYVAKTSDNDDTMDRLLAGAVWDQSQANQLYQNIANLFSKDLDVEAMSPLQAMVVRIILLHHWRRAILRDYKIPNKLREGNWPGFKAGNIMRELYPKLLEKSEIWLDQCQGAIDGELPKADPIIRERFMSKTDIMLQNNID